MLVENYFLQPEWADSVLRWLTGCLGWKVPAQEQPPAQKPKKKRKPRKRKPQNAAPEPPEQTPPKQPPKQTGAQNPPAPAQPPKAPAKRLADIRSVSAGDRVLFGSYPQDIIAAVPAASSASAAAEPVEWRVLAADAGRALLISEYVLDCKKYNETSGAVTWETCTLRRWLNDDFFGAAFSEDERKRITAVRNDNPVNPSFRTDGGDPTDDRVFCLSIDEVNTYLGREGDRMARPTAFARKNGVFVASYRGTGWWWLRSPGRSECEVANVQYNGRVDAFGCVCETGCGVRPAVWITL